MIAFWILAALATALAAWLVLTGARLGVDADALGAPDLAAAELGELDRLKARGLLGEDAFAAARAEAARRLIATPEEIVPTATGSRVEQRILLAGLALTALLAAGLYIPTGTPGLPDQPYGARVDEWATGTTPLEPVQVAAVLTRDAAAEPENMQLQSMLGAARFQAGDSIGAASAFRRVLAADPNDARSWARLGESLVRSQDGVVGVEAEAAFREAARRDPGQLGALYFLGEAAMARGDVAGVRATWTPLITALDPADPRRADLIGRLARLEAGERTPPSEATS